MKTCGVCILFAAFPSHRALSVVPGSEGNKEHRESGSIQLAIISDREAGVGASLESVCSNTAETSRLHFHVIAPTKVSGDAWNLQTLAKSCANGGAKLSLHSFEGMSEKVEQAGYSLPWTWKEGEKVGEHSVFPAVWDNSAVHNSPLNLLRFYIPQVAPFKDLKALLLLDDDIIVQKDIAEMWNFELSDDNVMSASCQNWVSTSCDTFADSTALSYLDVPYLGFGKIGNGSNPQEHVCGDTKHRECLPGGLLKFLEKSSRRINGENHTVTLETLRKAKAFNYGLNKFDLESWRRQDLTGKYASWMDLNREQGMFPRTSISYGLGLAMLTKLGRVQCYDAKTPVMQGLGFVEPQDVDKAALQGSFALHFNGPLKPWDDKADNPFSQLFIKHAPGKFLSEYEKQGERNSKRRAEKLQKNTTSFVVLTHDHSGAEWFMEMLDSHKGICAAGEADGASLPYPRDSLSPLSRHGRGQKHEQEDSKTSLLQVGAGSGSPPNSYALASSPEDDEKTCQMKSRCSWPSLSEMLWKATGRDHACSKKPEELVNLSVASGFGPHLAPVCQILRRAWWRATRGSMTARVSRARLVKEAFRVFFHYQMRGQFLSTAAMQSEYNGTPLLPCKCPSSANVMGQKVMYQWLNDDMVDASHSDQHSMQYKPRSQDFLAAMQEVGTKVVVLRRKNLLARFVSLQLLDHNTTVRCKGDAACLDSASRKTMTINIENLKRFVTQTEETESKTLNKLEEEGIPHLTVEYESCREDRGECLKYMSSFLGVRKPKPTSADINDIRIFAAGGKKGISFSLKEQVSNLNDVRKYLQEIGEEKWIDEAAFM